MDIIKARKRAKELEKKQKGKEYPEVEAPEKAAQTKAAEKDKKEQGKKSKTGKTGARKKTSTRKTAPKAPLKKEKTGKEKAAPEKIEHVKGKPSTGEDVFMDFSFGEDLPHEDAQPEEIHLGAVTRIQDDRAEEKSAAAVQEETIKLEPGVVKKPEPLPQPPPSEKQRKAQELFVDFMHDDESHDEDFLKLVQDDLFQQGFGEEQYRDLGPQIALLSFELGKETYAIPLTSIQQIIKIKDMTFVPRAPEYIAGVISLRGIVLPVFDLRLRLGLPAKEYARQTRIIVVIVDSITCGLIVDKVKEVVRVAEDSLEEPPAILGSVETDFLEAIGRFDGQMLILLNLQKVLALHTMASEKGASA